MTDVCTAALHPTKPSSDDGFRHGFEAEASLPLTQGAPIVTHNTTRLCWIVVTLWNCHIDADAVRALSWIFFIYFLLSDGDSQRLVKNAEAGVELVMKPRQVYPAISDLLFSQILIFFLRTLMCPVEIVFKRDRKLNNDFFI